jgi:erythromycin esterase-like protein
VLLALRDLLDMQLEYEAWDRDSFLDAAQNARLVASAERYYRAMYYANR